MKHLCYKCGEKATKLCDFRNYKKDTFIDQYGKEIPIEIAALKRCDKPMCEKCSNSYESDTDYCDAHNNELSFYKTEQAERVHSKRLKMVAKIMGVHE